MGSAVAAKERAARPFISIHAHFYQPPRESPWLRAVPRQPSAAPAHDWNERVAKECYSPCRAARLLDERDRVRRMVNLYGRLGFDLAPTLFRWLGSERPETAAAAVAGDRAQAVRQGGPGGAIAQPYHHTILPLAPARDRRTEIHWGLREFRARFGREAAGLWLPECAVDVETLEDAAAAGVRFVILAPGQAARVRPLAQGPTLDASAADSAPAPATASASAAASLSAVVADADADAGGAAGSRDAWREVTAETLDVTRLYRAWLPSGRQVTIAFYEGGISHDLAFGDLLQSGARLAGCLRDRAVRALDARSRRPGPREAGAGVAPPLILAAVDGETFGHHHRFGEMALAWVFEDLERDEGLEVGSLEAYVARWAPVWEVEVRAPSAWSCAHGVERWRSDCGCETGGEPGWHQRWRAPLRAALEGLRDRLDEVFERAGREVLADPWAAREELWELLVSPTAETEARFLERHAPAAHGGAARRRALGLLDLQRHALAMFTSCGWFFADLAGVEPVQNLQHAAYAIDLARRWGGVDLEPGFREALGAALGNRAALGDGRVVYDRMVAPRRVDLRGWGRILAARLAAASWRWHLAWAVGDRSRDASHLPGWIYGVGIEEREVRAGASDGIVVAVARGILTAPGSELEVPIECAAAVGVETFRLWAWVGEIGASSRVGFRALADEGLRRFRAGGLVGWGEVVEPRLGAAFGGEALPPEERATLGSGFEAAALEGLARNAEVWLGAMSPPPWPAAPHRTEAGAAGAAGVAGNADAVGSAGAAGAAGAAGIAGSGVTGGPAGSAGAGAEAEEPVDRRASAGTAGTAGDGRIPLVAGAVDEARRLLYAALAWRALRVDPPELERLDRLPAAARGAVRDAPWVAVAVRTALCRAARAAAAELLEAGEKEGPATARLLALLRWREDLAPRLSLWEVQAILWQALEAARAAPPGSTPLLDDLAEALGFSVSSSVG